MFLYFLYRRFRRSPRLVVCVAGLVCGEGSVLLSVKYCMDDCNVLSTALFGDESGVLVAGCWQQWHGKHSLFVTCDEAVYVSLWDMGALGGGGGGGGGGGASCSTG